MVAQKEKDRMFTFQKDFRSDFSLFSVGKFGNPKTRQLDTKNIVQNWKISHRTSKKFPSLAFSNEKSAIKHKLV